MAALKRGINKSFPFWQKIGIHVVLNDFFWPIPDTRTLDEKLWRTRSEMVGVNINKEKQFELLSLFSEKYSHEYNAFPQYPDGIPYNFYLRNMSFESVDAEILYCMIRHFLPSRIIEIGSGFSTMLITQALKENSEERNRSTYDYKVVDPYPNEIVRAGFPGFQGPIVKKVEDLLLEEFASLEKNDILFIDSSHILNIGSDVQYEFLEIIPRIKPGVIVHIHDIHFPCEYPREHVFKERIFFTEQYLLQSFLAFNDSFEVLWSGSYMNVLYPEKLSSAFYSYNSGKTKPGSFWMRRIK